MNFHHRRAHDEPEINLIPLIDVLLVILIFLAASTSFTRHRQLQVALPQAEAPHASPFLELAISRDGLYALDGHYLDAVDDAALADSLRQAAAGKPDIALRIDADGQTTHAAVVRALEAARLAHIGKVHFLTQARP